MAIGRANQVEDRAIARLGQAGCSWRRYLNWLDNACVFGGTRTPKLQLLYFASWRPVHGRLKRSNHHKRFGARMRAAVRFGKNHRGHIRPDLINITNGIGGVHLIFYGHHARQREKKLRQSTAILRDHRAWRRDDNDNRFERLLAPDGGVS
ncbi:hypothetical protein FNV43_RR21834 [Rhamnella rubrinervis]|uniref:Uncharacterized protein n=1 Tax=Rhamnella rubrinervis TaxID=2594499 RepID=A0A8K0DVD3_9ROSA|nr:hypothetical protein FNV43_RR21834 [Rhamnella rubrinervis]